MLPTNDLEELIKQLLKDAEKIKNKIPNFSRQVDKKQVILEISKIYSFQEENSRFFLFKVKNYENNPKYLYFLGKKLVSQSSDLIVLLSKDYALENEIDLVQFPLFPSTRRVNLLALKQIKSREHYSSVVKLLNIFRKRLLKKMEKIKKIAEN
jgi:hypothetical protein